MTKDSQGKKHQPRIERKLSPGEIKEILESMGGVRKIKEEMRQYYWDALRLDFYVPELTQEHPNHWAAVYDGEVVGIRKSFGVLLRHLRRSGIDTSRVAIQFLEHPRREHILKAA